MELQKINPACGNIDLIDENSCIGNSLDIINTNVYTLSSNLHYLTKDLKAWKQLCTIVSQSSAVILDTSLSIQRLTQNYRNALITVQTLSSSWIVNEFSLYYPRIFNYNTWVASPSTSVLINWINLNFPAKNYVSNQTLNLFVKLYIDNPFNFKFTSSYLETCTPLSGTLIIQCAACEDTRPVIACNQDIAQNGVSQHICSDAKNQCDNTTPITPINFSCPGSGGSKLTVGYQARDYDRFIYKSLAYKFISIPDPTKIGNFIWSQQNN